MLLKFSLYVFHATGMFLKSSLYVVNIRNMFVVFVFSIIKTWRCLLLAGQVKILLGCGQYTFVKWHLMLCDHHMFHLNAVHLSMNSREYLQKTRKSALPHFPWNMSLHWVDNFLTWWIKNGLLPLTFEHLDTITLFKWYEKLPKCKFFVLLLIVLSFFLVQLCGSTLPCDSGW